MKKLIYSIALTVLALLNTSCESYEETEIPEEYHKVLILQSAGEQPLTLYRTGEDSEYSLCIIKAGSVDGLTANVNLEITEEWLNKYNEDNGKTFTLLPYDLYELKNTNVFFAENDKYKTVNVFFKTTEIEQLINSHPEFEYVLPIQIKSEDTSISQTNNYVILKLSVVVPSISFKNTGYNKTILSSQEEEKVTIEIPVTMPLANNWDFDCTVEIDEALLDEYNEDNNTSYRLLPEDSYILEKICHFVPGKDDASFELTVDCKKLIYGDYVLPLFIQSCSQEGFVVADEAIHLAGISYFPPEIPLTLDMLSANSIANDGNKLLGLIDGVGAKKHFHSEKKVISPIGHYIDIELSEPISQIMIDYFTRFENGNGAPLEIVLYTKTRDTDWKVLTTISQGLPRDGHKEYQSAMFKSDTPFTYFRFCVTKSVKGNLTDGTGYAYFNMDDLRIFGQ